MYPTIKDDISIWTADRVSLIVIATVESDPDQSLHASKRSSAVKTNGVSSGVLPWI